jgi:hypothetical protein
MADYDMPAALQPQTMEWGIQKAGVQHRSPFAGSMEAVEFPGDYWTCSLMYPQRKIRNAGQDEAFFARLAGGADRVRVPNFVRPVPLGTLRGTPLLNAEVTRGARSLVLKDVDVTSDGPATLVARGNCQVTGTTVTKVGGASAWDSDAYSRESFVGGAYLSFVPGHEGPGEAEIDVMVGLNTDPEAGFSFDSIDFGWYAYGTDGLSIIESGSYIDDFGTFTASTQLSIAYDGTSLVYLKDGVAVRTVTPGSGIRFYLDSTFYLPGSSATEITFRPLATLRAGDFIKLSTQMFQVAETCTATAAGLLTVPLVNRVRSTIAADTAAVLDRPTVLMCMPSMTSRVAYFPGGQQGIAVDLEEAP